MLMRMQNICHAHNKCWGRDIYKLSVENVYRIPNSTNENVQYDDKHWENLVEWDIYVRPLCDFNYL